MDEQKGQLTSVRLTRKYADKIDGVDLSQNKVGDLLDVSDRDARLLIAEGWAAPCEPNRPGADGSSGENNLQSGAPTRPSPDGMEMDAPAIDPRLTEEST